MDNIKVEIEEEDKNDEFRTVAQDQIAEMQFRHRNVLCLIDGRCGKLLDRDIKL